MRVSTDKQADEGQSLETQERYLMEYIDQHSYRFVGKYVDPGISGQKDDERKAVHELLDAVKRDEVDIIIFTKLDRWCRSLAFYHKYIGMIKAHHAMLIPIWQPGYDPTTPEGELWVNFMLSYGQFEAQQTSERVKAVFRNKRAKGEALSATVPYGYRIENKKLVIDEENASKVLKLFEFIASGKSFADGAVFMTEQGHKMCYNGIRKLLANKAYIGQREMVVDGERIVENYHYCPPIVPDDLFQTVQRRLTRRGAKVIKHDFIFNGLVYCGSCGKRMRINVSHQRHTCRDGTVKVYEGREYTCNYSVRGKGSIYCSNHKHISEKKLEKYILDNVEQFFELDFEAKKDTDVEDKKAEIEKLRATLQRVSNLYEKGLKTEEAFEEQYQELTARIKGLEQEIFNPKSYESKHDRFAEMVAKQDWKQTYMALPNNDKRALWFSIFDKIVIHESSTIELFF